MTKTEIAKRLREIADNLELARRDLRGRSEDKVLDLLDASIEAESEITDLILKFNAGKLPHKTPVRNKSKDVFYIEVLQGDTYRGVATWDDRPLKKKLTTTRGWQKEFDYWETQEWAACMLTVFDANKNVIAQLCRDFDGEITKKTGR